MQSKTKVILKIYFLKKKQKSLKHLEQLSKISDTISHSQMLFASVPASLPSLDAFFCVLSRVAASFPGPQPLLTGSAEGGEGLR